ncbi:hypothetical protein [Dickeya poaceiphila]|uniref:Uncharacterized protein n=1 Tax=Dickeya poaceiphila TaxID=568768 RepID=A0A5B8I2Z0_9GAMM|nr:hypothetical protein [Dickeya poaceiphila]QDX29071.1 hypothetical protein Dpoa569_0000778 [Dickeya poaceiphila]
MNIITAKNISLLFDDDISEARLLSLATEIELPQRLSWLYILANVRDNKLLDKYDDLLSHPESKNRVKRFDEIYAKTKHYFNSCYCNVDRSALAEDIVEITQNIARQTQWDDLNFSPEHPEYMRFEYLNPFLHNFSSVQHVCQALNIDCVNYAPDSALININGYEIEIVSDSDNYADLRVEEGLRSASIALNAADFTQLTTREALELAHEIGHCRNHLTCPHPCGDFALPFWDTELPAFEEEWRLCTASSPHLDLRAWSLEAIKQSVFALFPLLAPEYGVERAFRYALDNNPLYCSSRKTPEWLLTKAPLFVWTGVPYVQYFLSLAHLILRHGQVNTHLEKLLARSYSRFTLRVLSADAE